jgi:hypothetical protein
VHWDGSGECNEAEHIRNGRFSRTGAIETFSLSLTRAEAAKRSNDARFVRILFDSLAA